MNTISNWIISTYNTLPGIRIESYYRSNINKHIITRTTHIGQRHAERMICVYIENVIIKISQHYLNIPNKWLCTMSPTLFEELKESIDYMLYNHS